MRTKVISIAFLGLLLAAGACSGSSSPKTATVKVQLIGTEQVPYWRPNAVTVAVGGTVTFENTGIDVRSIVSGEGLFNQSIQPGQSYKYTFTKAGTYTFHDEPNIEINTITVK